MSETKDSENRVTLGRDGYGCMSFVDVSDLGIYRIGRQISPGSNEIKSVTLSQGSAELLYRFLERKLAPPAPAVDLEQIRNLPVQIRDSRSVVLVSDIAEMLSDNDFLNDGYSARPEAWFKFEGHFTDLEQAKTMGEALLAVAFPVQAKVSL